MKEKMRSEESDRLEGVGRGLRGKAAGDSQARGLVEDFCSFPNFLPYFSVIQ